MADEHNVHAGLEEQRCLIERLQIQIQRLERRLEVQFRYVANLHAELDAVIARSEMSLQSADVSPSNGNGRSRGEPIASSDQP
jgi:hypothetical protein